MDFINLIPFPENQTDGFSFNPESGFPPPESDNQSAQSKFPKFPNEVDFSNLTTKQIGDQYYEKPIIDNDGVIIYVDPEDSDLETIILDEVVIENNRFFMDFDGLSVVLYAGRDGARLLDQYSRTQVGSKEIALFLEIDDSTNYFGSVMRILAGSQINSVKGLPHKEIARFAQSKGVSISARDMKDFLKEKLDGSKGGVIRFLMKCISNVAKVSTFIFDGLAEFFDKTIPDALDVFRIEDDGWNSDSYFFIPDKLIAFLDDPNKNNSKVVFNKIINPFFKIIENISGAGLKCIDLLEKFLPDKVYKKIRKVIESINAQIKDIKTYFKESIDVFLQMLSTSLKAFNAMLCGFVNSIVDFVKGIFQIIGIIFTITSEIVKISDNLLFYTEYISEIIENFIGAIVNIDYPGLFKQMLKAPVKIYNSIKKFLQNGISIDIDIVEVCYYVGYIIGLIVQTILEILFTGGTVTVAKIAEHLKAPFVAVGNIIKTAVKSAKTVFQRVLDFISFMVSKLKKPKQLIDDFIKFVDELLNGVGEKNRLDNIDNYLEEYNGASAIVRGRYRGQVIDKVSLSKISDYLKKLNVELQIGPAEGYVKVDGFVYPSGKVVVLEPDQAALFIADGIKKRIVLREKATVYEFLHELMHLRDCEIRGVMGFKSITTYQKEKFVFEKMLYYRKFLNRREVHHAKDYIDVVCYRYGYEDLNEFGFNINTIPLKRQKININKILNLE